MILFADAGIQALKHKTFLLLYWGNKLVGVLLKIMAYDYRITNAIK
jgi:hypothetical protein